MTVEDNRKEYDKFLQTVKDMKKKPYVATGILGTGKVSADFGVVQYATANEFGTLENGGFTPERSFIRSTIDEKRGEYESFVEKMKIKILTGKESVAKGLGLLGLTIQKDIQKKITDLSDPPNAPSTIKKKGSSNPLIDTGRMRQSVSFKVFPKGDK